MEKFYLPDSRQGEVKTGGESIVIYERWRRLGDPQLLQAIADYHQLDCSSTRQCPTWLACPRHAAHSAERRAGNVCVRTCRFPWSQYDLINTTISTIADITPYNTTQYTRTLKSI